jgi:PAP2 superfamily.
MFIIITLRQFNRWIVPLALAWATVVCWAQLYVGVHYPSDIVAGAFLGSIIGVIVGYYFKFRDF